MCSRYQKFSVPSVGHRVAVLKTATIIETKETPRSVLSHAAVTLAARYGCRKNSANPDEPPCSMAWGYLDAQTYFWD
jgi:hypothetical protein